MNPAAPETITANAASLSDIVPMYIDKGAWVSFQYELRTVPRVRSSLVVLLIV